MIFGINKYNKVSRFRLFEQVSSQCDRLGCLFEWMHVSPVIISGWVGTSPRLTCCCAASVHWTCSGWRERGRFWWTSGRIYSVGVVLKVLAFVKHIYALLVSAGSSNPLHIFHRRSFAARTNSISLQTNSLQEVHPSFLRKATNFKIIFIF